MRIFWLFVIAIGLTAQATGTAGAAPKKIDIGRVGSSFATEAKWRRQQLQPDMGRDQFVLQKPEQLWMFLLEEKALLETEQDFREAMQVVIRGLPMPIKPRGKIAYRQREHFGHTSIEFDAQVNGMKVTYAIHIFARDGLKYTLFSWTSQSKANALEKQIGDVIDHFSFPPPGSEWDKQSVPRVVKHRFRGFELSFKKRDSIFTKDNEPERLLSYTSHDQLNGMYAFELFGEFSQLDSQLDEVLRAANEGEPDPFVEQSRRDYTVGDYKGKMLICHDGTHTGHFLSLSLPKGRMLDIRYLHPGKPDAKRMDRDAFFDSLSLEAVETGLDLPASIAEPTPLFRDEYQERIAEKSTLLHQTKLRSLQRCTPAGQESFVTVGDRQVTLETQSETSVLFSSDDWAANPVAVRWQGRWIVATADEPVLDANTKKPLEPELNARLLATSGKSLYAVITEEQQELLGYDSPNPTGPDQLYRIDAQGQRKLVATFAAYRLQQLATSADGTRAVAVADESYSLQHLPYDAPPHLLLIDLQTGSYQSLGEWKMVEGIAPAEDHWLVTGTPVEAARGIHRVSSTGKLETLWYDTEASGIELTPSHLVYNALESREEGTAMQSIYRIALSDLAIDGPRCWPFCQASLSKVAEAWNGQLAESKPLQTADAIAHEVKRASAICEQLTGRPLPSTSEGIDQLCSSIGYGNEMPTEAQRLMSMVLTNALLEQGAEWVPSPGSRDANRWTAAKSHDNSNSFSIAFTPAALYTGTFHDSEGYWSPASYLLKAAQGRRIFIGHNPAQLRKAVKSAMPSGGDALATATDAPTLLGILEQVPKNLYLRAKVYRHLASTGRHEVLLDIAGQFASAQTADLIDSKALFAVRVARCDSDDEAQQLATQLLAALNEHPADESLYLWLGLMHQRLDDPPSERSRACFNRVLEITSWGSTAEEATSRLEALDAIP